MSTFSRLRRPDAGLSRLRSEIDDGTWRKRHGGLLTQQDLDIGYRLVVARCA
jgi:hypothetical protein